jgi:hypothetical protein
MFSAKEEGIQKFHFDIQNCGPEGGRGEKMLTLGGEHEKICFNPVILTE